MVRKVAVEALRVGMYVSDLNAEWMSHPFPGRAVRLQNETQIAAIRACGIREVFIDPRRGLDVEESSSTVDSTTSEAALVALASDAPAPEPMRPASVPPRQEFRRARMLFSEALKLTRALMHDIRLGRPIRIAAVEQVADELVASVLRNQTAMLAVCGLRSHCDYSFIHSVRVAVLMTSMARQMRLTLTETRDLAVGGLLHDLGKLLVDETVLKKPGVLTDGEFEQMREHVRLGHALLAGAQVPEATLQVLTEHHERYNGTGYPHALRGEEISVAGRLAAIADVYDAISSDRCYRRAEPATVAVRKVFDWAGEHFDPTLVQHFVRAVGIYPVGSLVRLCDGRLAVVVEHREDELLNPRLRVIFDTAKRAYVPVEDIDDLERYYGGRDVRHAIVACEDASAWRIETQSFVVGALQ